MAAASKSSVDITPPWCDSLFECVCTIRAALLRATSPFHAHCPLFWPQMADERMFKAQRHTLAGGNGSSAACARS